LGDFCAGRALAHALLKINNAKPGTIVRLTPPPALVHRRHFFSLDSLCPTSQVMLAV
jgi:hypothetical protein